jgi:uncharacterized protein YdaU (DUF1376 family)
MDRFKLSTPVFDKDEPAGGGEPDAKKKTDDGAGGDEAKKAGEQLRTFTQDDIDRIVKERLEREHKKQDEAATKAREEAEKKALEEQGKHKELADKATKDAERFRAEKEEAENILKTERIRYAVLSKAMAMNFADPEDAFKMSDFSVLELDESGKPKPEQVEKILKGLVEAKPYLVKGEEKSSIGTPKKKDAIKPKEKDETPVYKVPIPKF